MASFFRPPRLLLLGCFGCLVVTMGAAANRATSAPQRAMTRAQVLARAQVWRRTDVGRVNLLAGPTGPGMFRPGETIRCTYVDVKMSGLSPKFVCRTRPNETVLIKYGGNNGEVYGEMLATRLLWALGFGADRMYSVNVICRDCPETNAGIQRPAEEQRFDPALVERPMSEDEWKDDDKPGWAWTELDAVDPRAGGAPKAHRDALKLLAVFIQHTDSKPEQQRILCLGGLARNGSCRRPFLMISDLGLTFGRASRWNDNTASGVNLAEWRKEPVWTADPGCVGNLARSFTGTLDRPAISEDGRRFLADLLARLTDAQIRDLFTAARVQLRLREPGVVASGFATVEDWTAAFKEKRDQILRRRCAA